MLEDELLQNHSTDMVSSIFLPLWSCLLEKEIITSQSLLRNFNHAFYLCICGICVLSHVGDRAVWACREGVLYVSATLQSKCWFSHA
jgi:hypothetical protein